MRQALERLKLLDSTSPIPCGCFEDESADLDSQSELATLRPILARMSGFLDPDVGTLLHAKLGECIREANGHSRKRRSETEADALFDIAAALQERNLLEMERISCKRAKLDLKRQQLKETASSNRFAHTIKLKEIMVKVNADAREDEYRAKLLDLKIIALERGLPSP